MAGRGQNREFRAAEDFSSLEQLGDLLASGAISAEELTNSYLQRIKRFDPDLHAFSEVFEAQAIADARSRDIARARGDHVERLWGIPIAVKDLFDIAGLPTRAGSNALNDRHPAVSAHLVRLLEQAGMVILGRTHMVEFGFGGWGTNPVMGAPRNPWDRTAHRVTGGSSSGSAAAVAAGLVPAAFGTDTGGSVRTPAAWCGLIGMKTSHGLIGRGGVAPLCPTHDSIGWLTRTVRDAALLLNALRGIDPRDPATTGAPPVEALADIENGIERMRLGCLADKDLVGTEPDILAHYQRALRDFAALGARIETVQLPLTIPQYLSGGGEIMAYESYRALGRYVEAPDSAGDPVIATRILAGREIGEAAYRQQLDKRRRAQAEFNDTAHGLDALILPGSHRSPPRLDEVDEAEPPNVFGRLVNYLDLAALAVPSGLTGAGLPAGIQIVVRKYQDARALQIGRTLERHRGGLVEIPPGY